MQENDCESSESTRRTALRLIAGSGVGMLGVASSNVAAGETDSQQEGEEQTIAKGTSGYVTSDEETPDWFTLKSVGDAKWNIGDVNKKQNQGELTLYDHLSCNGDQLDWGGTITKWGTEFTLHLDHCAGTCNWEFEIEALEQRLSSGMNDDCNGEENFSGGIHPFQIEVKTRSYSSTPSVSAPIEYWDFEINIQYYDPRSGWEEATWEFRIDNPNA